MKIFTNLAPLPKEAHGPISLTIGSFDGVHLGHQELIKEIVQTKNSCLVTFRTPPSHLLQKKQGLVTTLEHKLFLLEKLGVRFVYLLDFTQDLAQTSPEDFLTLLQSVLPFSSLFLGYDACIGHERTGTPTVLQKIAEKMHFSLTYLPPKLFDGQIISSTLIREEIQKANFSYLKNLLGREYSISSIPFQTKKARSGETTLYFKIDQLVTPPFGRWICEAVIEGKYFPGIASLDSATFQEMSSPILQVELLAPPSLSNKVVEVIFKKFLEHKQKMSVQEILKNRIEINKKEPKDSFFIS